MLRVGLFAEINWHGHCQRHIVLREFTKRIIVVTALATTLDRFLKQPGSPAESTIKARTTPGKRFEVLPLGGRVCGTVLETLAGRRTTGLL
jgi:hypothetical protein